MRAQHSAGRPRLALNSVRMAVVPFCPGTAALESPATKAILPHICSEHYPFLWETAPWAPEFALSRHARFLADFATTVLSVHGVR
jgi:hypothetical protein